MRGEGISGGGRGQARERGVRLLIQEGTLQDSLREATALALSRGSLRPVPTRYEFVEQEGIRFLVRIVSGLKLKEAEGLRHKTNPFLPFEEDLFVADLTDGHVCLLNKFNVVEHHLLIVTRRFEDQETYLTRGDFAAALAALGEYESLAFYNAGTVAGASQRHKHLQLVPLPLAPEGPKTPVDPALASARYDGPVGRADLFPFAHAVAGMDPRWLRRPLEGAGEALALFHEMLIATEMEKDPPAEGKRQSGPYNLLATREWMLLVPRAAEFFEGTSINALGFAGALLVRNERELLALKGRGPLTALASVAFRRAGDKGRP